MLEKGSAIVRPPGCTLYSSLTVPSSPLIPGVRPLGRADHHPALPPCLRRPGPIGPVDVVVRRRRRAHRAAAGRGRAPPQQGRKAKRESSRVASLLSDKLPNTKFVLKETCKILPQLYLKMPNTFSTTKMHWKCQIHFTG